MQYLNDSWDKTHDENGEPIKPPPAETAVPKGFDYWKWLDQHNQLSGDIQRLEGEGGSYYSEERFEKAADIAYGLADFVRAQFARRGTKDTLARGVDFASNAAANQSASSGHAINYKSDDMKIKTAANPFIAAKAVRRTFVYPDKAKERTSSCPPFTRRRPTS